MAKKKIKQIILIFSVIFLLQFPFFWLRGGYITVFGLRGFPLAIIVYAIVFFLMTVWLLRRYGQTLPRWSIITAILIGASCLELFLRIFTRHDSLISLPDFIMRILAVLVGIWYTYIESKTTKIILVSCYSLFILWSSYFGFSLWLNKLNYNTISDRIEQVMPAY